MKNYCIQVTANLSVKAPSAEMAKRIVESRAAAIASIDDGLVKTLSHKVSDAEPDIGEQI